MILTRLQHKLNNLSKSERRIAEAILADPEAVVHSTTAELARRAGVSDPMISRLCRGIGCKGFPEFKVQLAQSLAKNTSFVTRSVAIDDDTDTYVNKLISTHQGALDYLRKELDPRVIESAVDCLDNAKRIEIFGMGGCASLAQDAQHKLFRLGTPTIAYEDNLKQRMAAAAANEDSVILFISFTGRTYATIETATTAKNSGARVLAITDPKSPLAAVCDLVITSGSELEDTTIYVPMTTTIMIQTIIDILATGLALKRSPQVDQQLKRIKDSLEHTRAEKK
ncbi:MAG: transcriptional regulator HexR [Gammaproteobacteria bacterium]|uniref:transcriptional regulator HexR n=1 Tax=Pseudomaricurvus alcaniphilus TaxID=1166482 RepID=UPI00140A2CA1|nr:transcriptional regulator HexR [Pseudomaricurvus alcaniphilus]MBR9912452.1 transcriptional regulator HexR [Gammaproteobacteria bacterium]NHN37393.1 transcriptional regulator HexR [Pseudomaricurvus alcaniphilus]